MPHDAATRGPGRAAVLGALSVLALAGSFATPAAAKSPAPHALILTAPADRSPSREAALTLDADVPGARFSARLDSGRWSRWTTSTSARFTKLAAGSHVVAVRAQSRSGRVGPVRQARFVVDLTRPSTSFSGAHGPATVLSPSSAVRFTANEPGSSFTCRVDRKAYRPCASPYVLTGLGSGSHRLSVRASDAAGNTDASPVTRMLTLDAGAPSGTLFSDDFETGDLSRWEVVTKDGSAAVQSTVVAAGSYSASFATTAVPGSKAYARTTLAASVSDLTVNADVRVDAEGAPGGNVPLLRLLDDSGARAVNVYRLNRTGQVWVQHSGGYYKTGAALPMSTWAGLSVRAGHGTIEVTLNGVGIYSTTSASLPAVRTLQLGNDSPGQLGSLDVDNVTVKATGADTTPPETTIDSRPSGTTPGGSASVSFSSSEPGSFQCSLDGAAYAACTSPQDYAGLAKGSHSFAVRAVDTAGNVDASPASAAWTSEGAPTPALLLADNQNRRILITDYDGKVLWKFDNPTGETSGSSGPLGVRWMSNGHILATFGTGKVGEIDPSTKTFVWKASGFNGDWFASPYDAEFLPDGNLAVATARNETGRVTVFNPTTGAQVWKYPVNFARLAELLPAGTGTNTTQPTLLMGGRDKLSEVVYDPGRPDDKMLVWQWSGGDTHRAILDHDGRSIVLSDTNNFIKVARPSQDIAWSHAQGNCCGEEMRGVAMTDTGYAYAYRIWYGASQVRFADADGNLLRSFTTLSDGSRLNLVWGVRTIMWNG
ncbi:MAG: PQQ-binding-like beta-propeller repeat protein [Marmoricola sp.]